jgi:diaminopimelate decarboxylase
MKPDTTLAPFAHMTASQLAGLAAEHGTPLYVYDADSITARCRELLAMPNAFGLGVRYAMKANSNRAVLQLVAGEGLDIDARRLNEVRRAIAAGIAPDRIMLTTQEVPGDADRRELEALMLEGLRYNACSLRQLDLVSEFAATHALPLSIRVHPGSGAGESATRNTGSKYSCFGIHLTVLRDALALADGRGVAVDQVHVHIGSGGDPQAWRENIDRELGLVGEFFPTVERVSLGGGFKVARMPGETAADIVDLGEYARCRFEEFHQRTGRKLTMEVEPGTYVVANSGYLATRVIDLKSTGEDGFDFILVDGGMEVNTRPLLYGSSHPFYILSPDGRMVSSEFAIAECAGAKEQVVVGRCCESGDSQTLDEHGHIAPRAMGIPEVGDLVVVGGCGAYCSTMSPFNYNSHPQASEVLSFANGSSKVVRARQPLEQVWQNEAGL